MPLRLPALSLGLALILATATVAYPQAPPATPPSQESATQAAKKAAEAAPRFTTIAIEKIKDEGTKNSQVMTTLDYLTNAIGPRLTASPNMKRANNWTRDKLSEWGLKDAHLEAWGPFGRGWSLKRFSAQVVEPQCIPIIAVPRAWTQGLEAPILGDVVLFEATNEKDLEKYRGKLKGAIILQAGPRAVSPHFKAPGTRLTDTEMLELADAQTPEAQGRRRLSVGGTGGRGGGGGGGAGGDGPSFALKRAQFLVDEGAAILAEPSGQGDGGTLFVDSARVTRLPSMAPGQRLTAWDKSAPKSLPQMVLAVEHYNRLVRMIRQGEHLKMAVDLAVQFHDDDLMGYNTVAEIPGTDLKDEIVMVGGHMDSWHGGTGATDNAAGVSCAMEAVRILQKLQLNPRRTIRIALWSGEEQGLYGSRAYVKEHFGSFEEGSTASAVALYATMFGGPAPQASLKTTPEYEKLSAYFNLDNGSGKVRGVYIEGNEAVRPIFKKWLTPFRELGATTITGSRTGGTDHMSFDAIGLPGFQFIQDPLEYDTRTHHSNMDVYERLVPDDLKQASVVIAGFLYNTAMADEKLPRKPIK